MRLKRRLSEIHPFFFHTRVAQLRLDRTLRDIISGVAFAQDRQPDPLPFTVKKHQSLLRRRLGDSDPELGDCGAVFTFPGTLLRALRCCRLHTLPGARQKENRSKLRSDCYKLASRRCFERRKIRGGPPLRAALLSSQTLSLVKAG
jgi:hypothetical protein